MKQDFTSKILFIITIIMLIMVFLIAQHYRDEVFALKNRIEKLEIIIEKDARSDRNTSR